MNGVAYEPVTDVEYEANCNVIGSPLTSAKCTMNIGPNAAALTCPR